MSPKLVEVSVPVEEISLASGREKLRADNSIRNVHKWFAPMPTPAWRALLFCALVDDPGDDDARIELLDFVKELVPPNGNPPSDEVLAEARKRIEEATGGDPPPIFDPFCGGGSTLVEAQRLGLPAIGSDLNPVPVLITRTLTELIPQVRDRTPLVGDSAALGNISGGGLDGFLSDCKHYATRVRDEVWSQIGNLYPDPPGGGTIIAWLWARTVTCPNPACRAITPLVRSYWLSKRKGAPTWAEPIPQGPGKPVVFEVRTGKGLPPKPTKVGRGGNFVCAVCGSTMPEAHQKAEGIAGRLGTQLMAVAADGPNGRTYLAPTSEVVPPGIPRPTDSPNLPLTDYARWFSPPAYGMTSYADLFTNRQLVALGAFADTVAKVPQWVKDDGGDATYATAVASVLGLCFGKMAMYNSTQGRWKTRVGPSGIMPAFSRHAIPMVWDFAEANPFGGSAGDWLGQYESVSGGLKSLPLGTIPSSTLQSDARSVARSLDLPVLIATDPPYFAQIGYADLSDYFYIWLRRALKDIHPELFKTIATPKTDELIAAPYRHEDEKDPKQAAYDYFVSGFTETFSNLRAVSKTDLPIMIVYAHRQDESPDGESSSMGWDAILTAIINAGLSIIGTWPVHAAMSSKQIGIGTNALATYVVLVCRPRLDTAKPVDLPHFKGKLRAELKSDIKKMQEASISSIDLAQAAIGPGMRIFTSFDSVLNTQGHPMRVVEALKEIGEVLGELLDDFAGTLDAETRWAMRYHREVGFAEAPYDIAEKIFKQANTSLDAVEAKGIARSRAGRVSLVPRTDFAGKWESPIVPGDGVVWEMLQRIVWELRDEHGGGEDGAAKILSGCMRWATDIQDLAYWLARECASRRPDEVLDYDAVTTSWSQLTKKAREIVDTMPVVQTFDDYAPDDEGLI